jgi:hypothetical protein
MFQYTTFISHSKTVLFRVILLGKKSFNSNNANETQTFLAYHKVAKFHLISAHAEVTFKLPNTPFVPSKSPSLEQWEIFPVVYYAELWLCIAFRMVSGDVIPLSDAGT